MSEEEEQKGTFVRYRARWVQLVLFCLISMSNALLWITFAPIANIATSYYDVDSLAINCMFPTPNDTLWILNEIFLALSLVYLFMYIPMVFPASLFLDRAIPKIPGGLRWGLTIGIIGSALSVR